MLISYACALTLLSVVYGLHVERNSNGDVAQGFEKCGPGEAFFREKGKHHCVSRASRLRCLLQIASVSESIPSVRNTLTRFQIPFGKDFCGKDQLVVPKVMFWDDTDGRVIWKHWRGDHVGRSFRFLAHKSMLEVHFLKLWKGLLVKLKLGCRNTQNGHEWFQREDCVIFKIQGEISHPIADEYFQLTTKTPDITETEPTQNPTINENTDILPTTYEIDEENAVTTEILPTSETTTPKLPPTKRILATSQPKEIKSQPIEMTSQLIEMTSQPPHVIVSEKVTNETVLLNATLGELENEEKKFEQLETLLIKEEVYEEKSFGLIVWASATAAVIFGIAVAFTSYRAVAKRKHKRDMRQLHEDQLNFTSNKHNPDDIAPLVHEIHSKVYNEYYDAGDRMDVTTPLVSDKPVKKDVL